MTMHTDRLDGIRIKQKSAGQGGYIERVIAFLPPYSQASIQRKLRRFRQKLLHPPNKIQWRYEMTLTFAPEFYEQRTMDYKTLSGEVWRFMNAMRMRAKRQGTVIKYARTYERGEQKDRPHFHLLLSDLVQDDREKACKYYPELGKRGNKRVLNQWANDIMPKTWAFRVWGQGRTTFREIPVSQGDGALFYVMKYTSKNKAALASEFFMPRGSRIVSTSRHLIPYPKDKNWEVIGTFTTETRTPEEGFKGQKPMEKPEPEIHVAEIGPKIQFKVTLPKKFKGRELNPPKFGLGILRGSNQMRFGMTQVKQQTDRMEELRQRAIWQRNFFAEQWEAIEDDTDFYTPCQLQSLEPPAYCPFFFWDFQNVINWLHGEVYDERLVR